MMLVLERVFLIIAYTLWNVENAEIEKRLKYD